MKKQSSLLLIFILSTIWCQAQDHNNDFSKLKIAVSGGYAFRLAKKAGTGQYFKDISQGPVFTSDATYYLNRQTGIGINYSLFSTAASQSYPSVISNIKINYIGASYNTRLITPNQKMELSTAVGLGYMGYKEYGWANDVKFDATGGTLGALLRVGGDVRIVKELSAGIDVNLYAGTLSSITINGTKVQYDKEKREGLQDGRRSRAQI